MTRKRPGWENGRKMISFCVLSSGSRANSIYVASSTTRILVDCGLSGRETAKRLASIGVEADSIDAVLITHEHDDHVAGVRVFAQRHGAQVFVSEAARTFPAFGGIDHGRVCCFQSGKPFSVGGLLVEPFSVTHDAADPVGFRISAGAGVLGIATDLGQITTLVRERTRGLSALVLESNHDPVMLQDSAYPWDVKQRIRSRRGHLSNQAAAMLMEELSGDSENRLHVAVAAHISEKTNLPELALEAFRASWTSAPAPEFYAASAFTPSPLFAI